MEYAEWAPTYRRIRAEFGFTMARERASARLLSSLLPEGARAPPLERLRPLALGREVVVVGLAPGGGAPPIWSLPAVERPRALFAADGAAARCLRAGLVPDAVVTDLDGPVPSEVEANAKGAFVVVHAHGDNASALRAWVPQLSGRLAGSWAGPATGALLDVGGFTDGDRAAYLAEHLGARRVLLWGFDFERVDEPDPALRARKLAKLAWARRALAELARRRTTPLLTWERDGTLRRYGPGPEATQ